MGPKSGWHNGLRSSSPPSSAVSPGGRCRRDAAGDASRCSWSREEKGGGFQKCQRAPRLTSNALHFHTLTSLCSNSYTASKCAGWAHVSSSTIAHTNQNELIVCICSHKYTHGLPCLWPHRHTYLQVTGLDSLKSIRKCLTLWTVQDRVSWFQGKIIKTGNNIRRPFSILVSMKIRKIKLSSGDPSRLPPQRRSCSPPVSLLGSAWLLLPADWVTEHAACPKISPWLVDAMQQVCQSSDIWTLACPNHADAWLLRPSLKSLRHRLYS